jgi:hypothetical protein
MPFPVGETSQSPQRGRAVLLFRTTPATIYTIARTGAMLLIGQERSRENVAVLLTFPLIENCYSVALEHFKEFWGRTTEISRLT